MENDFRLARDRRNALRREKYRLDGGKRNAENQAWKESHREQVRAASREYQRLLRARDPEHARQLQKASHARHREKRNAATRAWFKAHPDYDRVKQAEYRAKDPVTFMLRNAKNRAKERGWEFSLVKADISIPAICPILGIPIAKGSTGFHPNSPSVDRVDSTKGYTPGNVRVISWRANALKRDGTLDEFRKIVAYMEMG